jgi:hypothetical protein
MGCELGTEAEVDTDVIDLSSTAQRGDDVSHPQLAGRDYLDTRSFDTRGTNVRLGLVPVCSLSRRRSSSVTTSAGISSAAALLLALSRELERARVMVIKGRGARGAGVDSGRNVKGSTPSLPGRRTDGARAGGTIPVDIHVREARRHGATARDSMCARGGVSMLREQDSGPRSRRRRGCRSGTAHTIRVQQRKGIYLHMECQGDSQVSGNARKGQMWEELSEGRRWRGVNEYDASDSS